MVCPEFLRGRGAPSLISDSSKSKQAREANRPSSGKGILKHAAGIYLRPRCWKSSTPFPAQSSELLPCGLTVPENYHRVGSGRDRSEPIARLRNSRASG